MQLENIIKKYSGTFNSRILMRQNNKMGKLEKGQLQQK